MSDPVVLQYDQEYTVTTETIATGMDKPPSHINSFHLVKPMATPDGRLTIGTSVFLDPRERAGKEHVQIEFMDGQTICRDLSAFLDPSPSRPFGGNNWHPFALEDGVVYVQHTERAFFVPLSRDAQITPIEIMQSIGDIAINDSVTAKLQPNRDSHLVSNGTTAAIPLEDGSKALYLAFLTVDAERRRAEWSCWPQPSDAGKSSSEQARHLAASDLLQLDASDFPGDDRFHTYRPLVNQMMARDGKVYVYTKGHRSTPKWGYEYCGTAEIGPNGRVGTLPYLEDYTTNGDSKKRGIEGRFTTSGRYCILTPIYKSTDPWKGRQKILDMTSHQLIDVQLPRKHSKYRLIDHNGEYFWLMRWPAPSNEPQQFTRCCVA